MFQENVERDKTIMYDTVYVCILCEKAHGSWIHGPCGWNTLGAPLRVSRNSDISKHVNLKPELIFRRNRISPESLWVCKIFTPLFSCMHSYKSQIWKAAATADKEYEAVENSWWHKMENQRVKEMNLTPMKWCCNELNEQKHVYYDCLWDALKYCVFASTIIILFSPII